MPSRVPLELELPRTREAPRLARRRLAEWLAPDLSGRELDDAKLLVTELVTNALVYGRGRIGLCAQRDNKRLLIEVFHQGHGFERILRERGRIGGQGFIIVDALASRWGIHDGSSHVWCELERHESAHEPES